jgi:TPR repeat protein
MKKTRNLRANSSRTLIIIIMAYLSTYGSGCSDNSDAPHATEMAALVKRAESNDAIAQIELGEKYLEGNGVEKDLIKAKTWFENAEITGNSNALYRLGKIYDQGLGLPKDEKKAVELFTNAAQRGDALATNVLAWRYYSGQGTLKDTKKSVELWERAGALGHHESYLVLGFIFENDSELKNLDAAITWYEKAIEHDNAGAMVNLGYIFLENGPLNDPKKAMDLFLRAAARNEPKGQYAVGHVLSNGIGVPADIGEGLKWIKKAAEGGDKAAQLEFARALYFGNGVPKDVLKAAEWNLKAAVQGDTDAQLFIGFMYADGEGVTKDFVLAYAWTNLASTSGDKTAKQYRDIYELKLSKDERAEAQRLSSSWKTGMQLGRENNKARPGFSPNERLSKRTSGTAFFVTKMGYAITNHHVVNGCAEVKLEGQEGVVKVKAVDEFNDLALLEVQRAIGFSATILGDPTKLRQGEDIAVFGFPLNAVLSSGGNLTPGVISALTGLGNNINQIQITAPIQPGSSGSPVINNKGEVIGVVSMKLSDAKMANATGSVGQNVNFAVGGQTLRSFLSTHQVDFSTATFRFFDKSTADLADEARKWTFVVECWK